MTDAADARPLIGGRCSAQFAYVREEFERNFFERGEIGASLAIVHEGELAVDLWGGRADADGTPWSKDSLVVIQSATKGIAAGCAHLLIARGQLDLDAAVSDYWPDYANGKEHVPVRWLLAHLDGTPALRAPQRAMALLYPDEVIANFAAEPPHFEPGARPAYHGLSFGHLVSGLVRAVTGRTLGQYFREEIADPLNLDLWIGLPEEHHHRVVTSIAPDPPPPDTPLDAVYVQMSRPGTIQSMMAANAGGMFGAGPTDAPEAWRVENPSSGGLATAAALARFYAPLSIGGTFDGVTLFSPHQIARMSYPAAVGMDAMLLMPMAYSLGFWKSIDNRTSTVHSRESMILSPDAFGHPGLGGRLGFADPVGRFSFGYTNNKMGATATIDARGQALVDATYRSLHYSGGETGLWIR